MTKNIDYKTKTTGSPFITPRGAFRAYTLLELLKAGAVVNVDFGSGIFDSRQKKELAGSITDPKMAKRIQYIFASAEANAEHMRRDGSTSLIFNNSIAVQQAAGTSIGQKSSKIGFSKAC